MSNRVEKRIFNVDVKNYMKDNLEENGIYIHFNEIDIKHAYILIIGPEDTPYENGYYLFNIKFTDEYPYKPPKVHFVSNSPVRIHPNLYVSGKVCLSILGTWAGPSWTSVMDINSIAKSIQSLLSKNAIQNEPGYLTEEGDICNTYDRVVWFENFRSYIIKQYDNKNTITFKNLIKTHFIENYKKNKENIKNHIRYNKPELILSTSVYNITLQENIKNLEKIFDEIKIE